jgi:hypothetical protein
MRVSFHSPLNELILHGVENLRRKFERINIIWYYNHGNVNFSSDSQL